jgi:hypothetical protein
LKPLADAAGALASRRVGDEAERPGSQYGLESRPHAQLCTRPEDMPFDDPVGHAKYGADIPRAFSLLNPEQALRLARRQGHDFIIKIYGRGRQAVFM